MIPVAAARVVVHQAPVAPVLIAGPVRTDNAYQPANRSIVKRVSITPVRSAKAIQAKPVVMVIAAVPINAVPIVVVFTAMVMTSVV